ncbi:MAG: tetratricopeptide repeat protein, partial [Planctomycetaceae bacterium]|nr:tetratricopeptide repeat protein [Planctomycetaceae bacterium]
MTSRISLVACQLTRRLLVPVAMTVWLSVPAATECRADETDLSEEESRQTQIAERFLGILEKNPRYGTALDRVYGHHIEFGTLDAFLTSLRERTNADPQNGSVWMLLGMFETQRGNDGAAVEALLKADALRLDDPLASFYLGQAQLRTGENSDAIASFERAIKRNPARTDLLEIFQTLGRVHQRAQRTEEAMGVWQRLESLFPDDPRVLEQIAATLAEEGQPEQALPRYQKLTELVKDDYRRVVYQVSAAELMIRTGDREGGLRELEAVLSNLNPEGWLHRDVRRRIEEVFLRSGDQDSLVSYYERWL